MPGTTLPPDLAEVRSGVERTLRAFLEDERAAVASEHPAFLPLLDEVGRMVEAGGKRLRPMFCVLGYRAGDGTQSEAILHVAAALELFHTFALIHDDVMDESVERRGAPTIHVRMAERRRDASDAERFGLSAAILAGDFAMVLADHLFLGSGFPPGRLAAAFRRYNRMRVEVAVGQFLDLEGSTHPVDRHEARRIASLKSGGYTVEGPLHIGAVLAGASIELLSALSRYAVPLGEAFQIQDDLASVESGPDLAQRRPTVVLANAAALATPEDRRTLDAITSTREPSDADLDELRAILERSGAIRAARDLVRELAARSIGALDDAGLAPEVWRSLRWLAEVIARPEAARPARETDEARLPERRGRA
jgi:geranylgeranyl diphosphate synthase, type I